MKVVKLSMAMVIVAGLVWGASTTFAAVTVEDSVKQALQFSPRLKVLKNNRDAIGHEVDQAKGGFLPSVDAVVGYGIEVHSDSGTRTAGNEPADDDWESRGEASLNLRQLLYDGGEVSNRVDVERARYDSLNHRVFDNAESIALDAVIAHMEVYRQREILSLAEQTVKAHEDILSSLEKRQRAGAGSVADVTQTQGRLARAISSKLQAEAELGAAVANYQRVVGKEPTGVVAAELPPMTPNMLEEAIAAAKKRNPKIQAFGSDIEEAEAREGVAKSTFFPKVNLELSSTYDDQVEGDNSWQWTNAAMVRARWNLLNGGSDAAARRAALSRKYQAISDRNDQLIQIIEETQATWAQLQAAKARVKAFSEAVRFNEKTLDSYLKQFNVAQRSLLDVLDAENELFQSSGLLVTAKTNEVIAAYRLLALGGNLQQSMN